MQHTERHIHPDAHLDDGVRAVKRRCFCASCTQARRVIGLLATHPLVLLNMPHYDTERYQCARYLHHLQTQRQSKLNDADMLDAIERCRCEPYAVGKELDHGQ